MSAEILISGATGTLGSLLRAELQSRSVPFRALVHSAEKANDVKGEGAEAVVGDLTDPSSLTAAFKGVTRAFLLTPGMPFHPQAVVMGKNFAAAAKEAGVEHIVVQSMYGLDDNPERPQVIRDHAQTQQTLRDSGIGFTTLGSNYGMQALAAQGMLQTAQHQGSITHALDVGVSYVDFLDVATAAAICLTEEGHAGKFYKLTGPEELTAAQLAGVFSDVLGKEVKWIEPTAEETYARLKGFGMPDIMIEAAATLNASNRTGRLGGLSPDFKALAGREPGTFRAFVERSLA